MCLCLRVETLRCLHCPDDCIRCFGASGIAGIIIKLAVSVALAVVVPAAVVSSLLAKVGPMDYRTRVGAAVAMVRILSLRASLSFTCTAISLSLSLSLSLPPPPSFLFCFLFLDF